MAFKILKNHPGCEGDIKSMHVEEEALKPSPFFQVSDTPSKKNKRNRFFSYKFALFAHDLIIVLLAFGLGGLIIDSIFYFE